MSLKILYIVGDGSIHDNIELRWSLRSLDRFCTSDIEPVIVGKVPRWFKGEGLAAEDKTERKEKNIMAKILAAIDSGLVGHDFFQISADDHFWLRSVNLYELPVYYRRPILPEYNGGNNYEKALADTRRVLLDYGYPAFDTTVHCNQWADARLDLEVMRLMVASELPFGNGFHGEYGIASWAVFPNVAIGSWLRQPIREKTDVKIRQTTTKEFFAAIENQDICSVNDAAFENPDVVKYFTELYSGKSRWER